MACKTLSLSQIAPFKNRWGCSGPHFYGIAGSKFNAVSIKQSS